MNRNEKFFLVRLFTIVMGGLRLFSELIMQKITLRQAYYQIQMRLFNENKHLNDDFDWTKYHHYYREELKSVGRGATLIPLKEDFEFSNGHIQQKNNKKLPLHANAHLLYEIILSLNPASILEVGCGGGDHLRNLHMFKPEIDIYGLDRSEGQLLTFRDRHPDLSVELKVQDLTNAHIDLPIVDIAYSHAVLMHISESQNRFANALANMLKAASSQVVLLENWVQHDFLSATQEAIKLNPSWANAKIYFTYRPEASNVRALILSKHPLPFEELKLYDSLLQGKRLEVH